MLVTEASGHGKSGYKGREWAECRVGYLPEGSGRGREGSKGLVGHPTEGCWYPRRRVTVERGRWREWAECRVGYATRGFGYGKEGSRACKPLCRRVVLPEASGRGGHWTTVWGVCLPCGV